MAVVREVRIPSRVGSWALFVGHAAAVGTAGAIVLGSCAVCTQEAQLWSPASGLGFAGLGYAMSSAASAYRGRNIPLWQDLSDAMTLLGGCAGMLILSVASLAGASPCFLCVGFWAAQCLLLLELLGSRRVISRWWPVLPLVGACTITVLLVPTARAELQALVPVARHRTGPQIGQEVPSALVPLRNGIFAFATDCAPCMRSAFADRLAKLRGAGLRVEVLGYPGLAEVNRTVPETAYRQLRIRLAGAPTFLQLRDGKVSAVGTAADFQPLEEDR